MNVEDVLDQALKRLLYELDIPKEIFEESVLVRMDQRYFQQLYMLQASVKKKDQRENSINQEIEFKINEGHYSIKCTHTQKLSIRISCHISSISIRKYNIDSNNHKYRVIKKYIIYLTKLKQKQVVFLKEQGIRLNDISEKIFV